MRQKDKAEIFRKIPSVDRLLNSPELIQISSEYPRNLVLRAINQVLGEIREGIEKAEFTESPAEFKLETVSNKVTDRLKLLSRPSLRPVINATGVIVHTNLGRSILADRVIERFGPLSGGYSNLE